MGSVGWRRGAFGGGPDSTWTRSGGRILWGRRCRRRPVMEILHVGCETFEIGGKDGEDCALFDWAADCPAT